MILSNDGLVAFHYSSYGTFFLHKNRLHNIYRGFTHYKYYRAKIIGVDGTVANCGVHGKPVQFDLDTLWIRNINVTTGLVSTNTTPQLLKALESHKIEPEKLVTHYFKLSEIERPMKCLVRPPIIMRLK